MSDYFDLVLARARADVPRVTPLVRSAYADARFEEPPLSDELAWESEGKESTPAKSERLTSREAGAPLARADHTNAPSPRRGLAREVEQQGRTSKSPREAKSSAVQLPIDDVLDATGRAAAPPGAGSVENRELAPDQAATTTAPSRRTVSSEVPSVSHASDGSHVSDVGDATTARARSASSEPRVVAFSRGTRTAVAPDVDAQTSGMEVLADEGVVAVAHARVHASPLESRSSTEAPQQLAHEGSRSNVGSVDPGAGAVRRVAWASQPDPSARHEASGSSALGFPSEQAFGAAPASLPSVQVVIGRIEVRANPSGTHVAVARSTAPKPTPAMSLSEYLRRRGSTGTP